MAELSLSHYTDAPLDLDPSRTYEQSTRSMKPSGLWVSVDGEDDWESWCRSEQFHVGSLQHRTPITLAPGHNVLVLSTPKELVDFGKKYGGEMTPEFLWIDWPRVAADYDGLIIAPYQWSQRYAQTWYYGWDCASGCIWNLSAIEVASVSQAS